MMNTTLIHLSYEGCENSSNVISDSIREVGIDVLVLASSDLNHYENQSVTEKKDMMVMLSLDPTGLLDVTLKQNISMCGVIPTTVMLLTCLKLGAHNAELLKHATPGEVNGDYDRVIGYAAIWVC